MRRTWQRLQGLVGSADVRPWESVAGAIGPAAGPLAERSAALGWPWRTSKVGPANQRVALLASGPLSRVADADGWYWNPVDPPTSDPSCVAAQQDALAASCTAGPEGWELSTDVLGVQALFYAVVDGSLWFSTSARTIIELVAEVVDRDLSTHGPDPVGWQSIILLGFPPPGDSAFRGVQTLLPGQSLRLRSDGRLAARRSDPAPAAVGHRTIDDLLDALRASMPPSRRALDVPLSGGWDSRLLAGLLAEQGHRRLTAWTTTTDDGIELDLALAPAVARHLRIDHRVVVDDTSTWPELATTVLRRTDYQTWMHAWLLPLAEHLRRHGVGTVADGFGGDFVLRRLFQSLDRDGSPTPAARRDMWAEMGGSRAASDVAWSDEARRWFATGASAESFERSVVGFDQHPNWQALTVVTTRAARCIGLAPFRVLGPELAVVTPFLSAAVRDVLYSEAIYTRRGPDLYRSIIARLDGELADLPTTNDPDLERVRSRARREISVASLTAMATRIAANDDAMRLLAPRLRDAVRTTDLDVLAALTAYVVPLRALQAADALAQWHLDHPGARSGIWTS